MSGFIFFVIVDWKGIRRNVMSKLEDLAYADDISTHFFQVLKTNPTN